MEQIQVIGGSYGEDIVPRVPRCVQDLPSVVQRLDADLVLLLAVGGDDPLVAEDLAEGGHVPRGLVTPILSQLSVGDPKEVVVCPSYDFSAVASGVKETSHTNTYTNTHTGLELAQCPASQRNKRRARSQKETIILKSVFFCGE